MQLVAKGRVQAGVEKSRAPFACSLGLVHRKIRIAQHLFGSTAARIAESNTDARERPEFGVIDANRLLQSSEQELTQFLDLRSLVDAVDEDGELVASDARDQVLRPDARDQPGRRAFQQLVPCGMAEAVVDGLEPIEVQTT